MFEKAGQGRGMKTIVCYGDSNTHGTVPITNLGDRHRYAHDQRWPGVMAKRLRPQWRVIEEGLPGRTTVHDDPIEGPQRNGKSGLPISLETHRDIDLLIIMLGTNDLKPRFGVSAYEIAASAGKLAMIAKASQCGPDGGAPKILLVAPPPARETGVLAEMFAGAKAKSERFGELYRKAARDNGCLYLDAGDIIESSATDGVHFEPDMHARLGNAIADLIEQDSGLYI
ncbi:MAG: hydrolase [Rhizobiaceae bacterium MnEN-MB40S]|nr:MAG: hydrolase [Rhizobiaceae bacterium MnEN-MB40S]